MAKCESQPSTHNVFIATFILCAVILISGSTIFPSVNPLSPVTPVLTGLNFPVSLKFSPDVCIFFNEKNTVDIQIILHNCILLLTPSATVSQIFNGCEAGLMAIAIDPSFVSNEYVYV